MKSIPAVETSTIIGRLVRTVTDHVSFLLAASSKLVTKERRSRNNLRNILATGVITVTASGVVLGITSIATIANIISGLVFNLGLRLFRCLESPGVEATS